MTEEIKEILDTFKELTENYSASSLLDFEEYEIPCIQLKMVLDYITNLQQKYEISQKDIQSLKNNYNDLVKISENKITNLQQENERLKNGYCELKEKCNNGECDCTNEEYNGMVEGNIKLSLEVERLNNIINECAADILKELKENSHLSYGVALAIRQKLINYRELKEGE